MMKPITVRSLPCRAHRRPSSRFLAMRRWEEQQGRRARESILSSLHYTAKDRQERDTGNDTRMDTVALLEEALLIAESALRSSSEVTVAPSTVTVVDDPDARESRDDTNL